MSASPHLMRLRRAASKIPAKSSVPPRLPLHKYRPLPTPSKSTLPQLLIPLHFISLRMNVYKKPGGASPSPHPKVLQLATTHASLCISVSVHPSFVIPLHLLFPALRAHQRPQPNPLFLPAVSCQLSIVSSPATPFPVTLTGPRNHLKKHLLPTPHSLSATKIISGEASTSGDRSKSPYTALTRNPHRASKCSTSYRKKYRSVHAKTSRSSFPCASVT